jgi:site-specific DNA-methyltransferase (adenine-specific)
MIKPYYEENGITIYHGDCREILPPMGDKSIDMILCDLPYGTTTCKWDTIIPLEFLWEQYKRLLKDNRAIVLTASQPFTSALVMSNKKMFKYEWIWHKSKSGSAFTAKYRPVNKHENVLVFGKGTLLFNPQKTVGKAYHRTHDITECDINNHNIGFNRKKVKTHNSGFRYPTTVQYFQQKWRRQDQLHPTQKPVALFEYLIRTYTNDGDTVLDNCSGSGTTGIAALITKRNAILIDVSEKYCEIAAKRLAQGVLDFAS